MKALIVIAFLILCFAILTRIRKSQSKEIRHVAPEIKKAELEIKIKFDDSNKTEGEYLIFDIETTGLPQDRDGEPEDFANWPYVVQFAWLLFDKDGKVIEEKNYILNQKIKIPEDSVEIHGITNEIAEQEGVEPKLVYSEFLTTMENTQYLVAHHMGFDLPILKCELLRNNLGNLPSGKKAICTMKKGTAFCKLPGYSEGYKYPKLEELFKQCFYPNVSRLSFIEGHHQANVDAAITAKCFFSSRT